MLHHATGHIRNRRARTPVRRAPHPNIRHARLRFSSHPHANTVRNRSACRPYPKNTALIIRFVSVMMFLPHDRRTRSTGFPGSAVHRDFHCHFSRAARRQHSRVAAKRQTTNRHTSEANEKRPDGPPSERFPYRRNTSRLRIRKIIRFFSRIIGNPHRYNP